MSSTPAADRRAAIATRLHFACLGIVSGAWGAQVPAVRTTYGLEAGSLSLIFLCTSVGALMALMVAGRLVARLGARGAATAAVLAVAAGLALVLHAGHPARLALLMVLLGFGESVYDIAINAEGALLEQRAGRPLIAGFHGMWSIGAMAGAAAVSAMLGLGIAPPTQLVLLATLVGAGGALASRWMLPAHPDAGGSANFAWPRGVIRTLGFLVAVGLLAEGAMYNWSVLYVERSLGATPAIAALAYVSFAGTMAALRMVGDRLRARIAEPTLLQGGALVAGVAIAIAAVVRAPLVALVAFGVAGAGLAIVVPVLYARASRAPGVSPAAGIATVSALGMVGIMSGSPMVGAIAARWSLGWGMGAVAVACLVLAAGTRALPVESRPA